MIYYASRTGTRRNLAAFAAHGWRLLVSAAGEWRTEGLRYAVDNGAWSAFTQGRPFDIDAYRQCVEALGDDADFVVLPDVVMGGHESLLLSLDHLDWTLARTPRALLPVQPGMRSEVVASFLSPRVGVFVGGDDTFKEGTMAEWSALAHAAGAVCHVGRVNTRRRVRLCMAAKVDSADGSSGSRFAVNVPKIDGWRRQTSLLAEIA